MAIQMRRGNYADFDASKMVAGEFGICLDNGYVYITLSPGNAVRLGTADTIEEALSIVRQYAESASASATSSQSSATSSSTSATNSESSAKDSEAWAVGQRGGIDVEDDDDTYHNNSKYYAEQAEHFSENATYLYIRYSQYSDGTDFTTTPQANTKYIGIYSGSSSTAPTDKTAYNWVKFVGQDGTGGAVSDLTDVALSPLQDEQVLRYDATLGKWVNADNSGGGGNDVGLSIVEGEINVTYDPDGTRVKEPLCLDETLQGVNDTLDGIKDAIQGTVGLQPATASRLGGIKVGSNLTVAADGTLSASNSYVLPTASSTTKGGIQVGTGFSMSGTTMNLNTASSSTLGGVKVGNGLSISNGVLSNNYSLPTASLSTLGGVKIDVNKCLSIDSSGLLSFNGKYVERTVSKSISLAANKFKCDRVDIPTSDLPYNINSYSYIPIIIRFFNGDGAYNRYVLGSVSFNQVTSSNIRVYFTAFNSDSSTFAIEEVRIGFLVLNTLEEILQEEILLEG